MQLLVQCELNYQVNSYATSVLSFLALKSPKQQVLEETLLLAPQLQAEELSSTANSRRFIRLEIRGTTPVRIVYQARVETFYEHIPNILAAPTVLVAQMPEAVIPYLFPSRYCQSDQLLDFAWQHFGGIAHAFEKAMAVSEWIYAHIAYVGGSSDSHTSAIDTLRQRAGVCRDFAHLGIALCRALSIPARYFTCYAYKLVPPDFHACFEAYIGGKWLVFDATRLAPLNGLVKIAHGRDAADVSVATSFGEIWLTTMQVSCQVLEADFVPFVYNASRTNCLSY